MSSSFIGSFLIGQKVGELETALAAANAQIETAKTDIAVNASNTSELQTWASDRVKYAYPNGGSEGDEKTLSLDSIYQTQSPFPVGVSFSSRTEFFSESNQEWIDYERSFFDSNYGEGLGCTSSPRVSVALVAVYTGDRSLGGAAQDGGSWSGSSEVSVSKWRVRCIRED